VVAPRSSEALSRPRSG